jgi:hypothetical protein
MKQKTKKLNNELIRGAMSAQGITIEALAKEFGIDKRTFYRREDSGWPYPAVEKFQRMFGEDAVVVLEE